MSSTPRKRFSHRFKEPFGKAGLTVAILALVLAMVGGAYAAGGLTKSQEKQVTKIAKKYAGKPGTPGANGTNGAPGAKGDTGVAGSNGTNGKGVLVGNSTECGAAGGKFIEVEGSGVKNKVCNGAEGQPGPEGNIKETLPKGSTETGVWSIQGEHQEFETEVEGVKKTVSTGSQLFTAPISFVIPLAKAPTPHFIPEGVPAAGTGDLTEHSNEVTNLSPSSGKFTAESVILGTGIPAGTTINNCLASPGEPADCASGGITGLELSEEATASGTVVALHTALPAGCSGSVSEPEAEEGNLCVFTQSMANAGSYFGFDFVDPAAGGLNEAGKLGTLLVRKPAHSGIYMEARGTWAVTASE